MDTPPDCIKTTCPYCGVGCGVDAEVADNQLIAVSGTEDHPANLGRLCVKGSALHETMGSRGRLLAPMVDGQEVEWPEAIQAVADRLNHIRATYGPSSIAFYLSGQLLTEDYYVANKLAKGFIGTPHVDTNSRLCMSSAVAGHKRAFGADAVPCSYEDLECCDLLILVGSNAAWTHPVLYQRMVAAKKANPNMRVVVIDPRRTATCDIADLHLEIAPGSDAFLFTALLNHLNEQNCIDAEYIEQHTEGFAQALEEAKAWATSQEDVSQALGLNASDLTTFLQWFTETERTITFYSQGINQSSSGTDKCNAIINCHLATGRIGKQGAGPFSITGQPNAMGGREVGGLANQLAAHMDYSPENRELVSEFWQTSDLSPGPGYKAVDLFEAVGSGEIKAVWIMGTNPVVSMPNADRVKAALEACDTVVVSDCIAETDTTATANILLPATGWGEKDGTVTNSERRISRQRALLQPSGAARHDWWIMSQVAQTMGFENTFRYQSPRDVFVEHAQLSGFKNDGQRIFNISGLAQLSEKQYDELAPIQWPVTADKPSGTPRLFENQEFVFANNKARFLPITPRSPVEELEQGYPLALNTGRIRDQWHTMTRTARSERLRNHIDEPFVAINPKRAAQQGLSDGCLAKVSTAAGEAILICQLDPGIPEDQLFVPIHWNNQYSKQARVDALVPAHVDPVSGQPEFKHTPAAIELVETVSWARIVSRHPIDCEDFAYWTRYPLNNQEGFIYTVAVSSALSSTLSSKMDWEDFANQQNKISNQNSPSAAAYNDLINLDTRIIYYQNDRVDLAIFSHSDKDCLPDSSWLCGLLERPIETSAWALLAGKDLAQEDKGALVCSCYEVGEKQIRAAIAAGAASTEALGKALGCGTNCGSCIPELNQLLDTHKAAELATDVGSELETHAA